MIETFLIVIKRFHFKDDNFHKKMCCTTPLNHQFVHIQFVLFTQSRGKSKPGKSIKILVRAQIFFERVKKRTRPPLTNTIVVAQLIMVFEEIISLLLFSCRTFVVIFFNDFLPLLGLYVSQKKLHARGLYCHSFFPLPSNNRCSCV